jgi:hypothetical protein
MKLERRAWVPAAICIGALGVAVTVRSWLEPEGAAVVTTSLPLPSPREVAPAQTASANVSSPAAPPPPSVSSGSPPGTPVPAWPEVELAAIASPALPGGVAPAASELTDSGDGVDASPPPAPARLAARRSAADAAAPVDSDATQSTMGGFTGVTGGRSGYTGAGAGSGFTGTGAGDSGYTGAGAGGGGFTGAGAGGSGFTGAGAGASGYTGAGAGGDGGA